jgi:hypothetical protein
LHDRAALIRGALAVAIGTFLMVEPFVAAFAALIAVLMLERFSQAES